jgi:D-amino peptidase
MRVLVQADMDGISQITDFRECIPLWPEYWATGRRKMTADTTAAALGLFDGGATEVVIRNSHGAAGWPNLIPEDLPTRLRVEEGGFGSHATDEAFDATFQVGRHARCGTSDGFMSHTGVPDLRVALDGLALTESHCMAGALPLGLPVLGVIGDAALGRELNGFLAGTPFLAVKRSISRCQTTPLHADLDTSGATIRTFAEVCAKRWRMRLAPRLPARFTVEVSMDPAAAEQVVGQHSWERVSPAVLRLEAEDWQREAAPAIGAAARASAAPLLAVLDGMDLSTAEAVRQQVPDRVEAARRAFADFA